MTCERSFPNVLRKWRAEQERFERLGATANASALAGQILDEIDAALARDSEDLLPLGPAAKESGYSASHLGRLIREGRLPNLGKPHAPRVRRADLPRKPAALRSSGSPLHLLGVGPAQVARSIVTPEMGGSR